MCQAIPRQVLQVADGRAEVLIDNRPTWVTTIAVPDIAPGEYVVVYADAAVERIPQEEALELLEFLTMIGNIFEEDPPALPAQRG